MYCTAIWTAGIIEARAYDQVLNTIAVYVTHNRCYRLTKIVSIPQSAETTGARGDFLLALHRIGLSPERCPSQCQDLNPSPD